MKTFYFIPLIFLSACSTTPKLTLRPQSPPPPATDSLRYPEVVRAYHFGRYVDPGDDLVMHEEHTVYRVEENTRWNFHPAPVDAALQFTPSRDAAFFPIPVNDTILAEVNSQKLATVQIMAEGKILASALQRLETALQDARKDKQATAKLQITVDSLKKQLDALESASAQSSMPTISTTNETDDSLSP